MRVRSSTGNESIKGSIFGDICEGALALRGYIRRSAAARRKEAAIGETVDFWKDVQIDLAHLLCSQRDFTAFRCSKLRRISRDV